MTALSLSEAGFAEGALSPRALGDLLGVPGLRRYAVPDRIRQLDFRLLDGAPCARGEGGPVVLVTSAAERLLVDAALSARPEGSDLAAVSSAILSVLQTLLSGELFVPAAPEDAVSPEERAVISGRIASLTNSQTVVLAHLLQGRLNKQIAYDMGISLTTVKSHVTGIIAKMHVVNRVQAVILANRIGFDGRPAIAAFEQARASRREQSSHH